ncbi:MAG: ATP-binding cassette domain-containing protein, partial [Steroidobacteraceae bacterium]
MIEIKGLNQFYGGSHILWDIDLAIPKGECTVLMGRNGMGKTTLLKCLMGLVATRSGSVHYAGQDLLKQPASARAHLGIGYVPQGREIFSQLTVEENLRTGLTARKDGLKTVPEHIYQMFPVLKQMAKR